MELKKYQKEAIEALKNYILEAKKLGPKIAFISATEKPYKEHFNETPCVCIKIPTGGGKTLVATHAVGEITDTYLNTKFGKGIVLWFVPSDAICSQTLKKLMDKNDPHRQVLDEFFDNKVKVFSTQEALRIKKQDVENNLCIIISMLDAFRKEKNLRDKYKVYKENGELLTHFENSHEDTNLEKDENNTVINSLSNVIRKDKPLIIIDEGHRAKTILSIDFLKDLHPSFILEFTATPREESSVIVNIPSSKLKEEKMVKIPIILESVSQWQQAIIRGVNKRKELEEIAKKEKNEYIRPIALFQAEQEKESNKKVTVGAIRDVLIKEAKILEDEIAIKTSTTDQLTGIDLFSKNCKIRYILTVNALAEGWDCSFAYLLISVANIGSKISVEQIIGRIVRLPNAKEKNQPALNNSYIFASAKNFNEAATQIVSGLENNGFSREDLINASAPNQKYEFEAEKITKDKILVPYLALKEDKLEFGDLLEGFELSKTQAEFEFKPHFDSDGIVKIDINKEEEWWWARQTTLNLIYRDKNFSEEELTQWLDKKLRFIELEKQDKLKFIKKAIEHQLKNHHLSELSVNRFVLKDELERQIIQREEEYTKKQFQDLIKNKKITLSEFEDYPQKIILSDKENQEFKRNFYDGMEKLNKEELNFVSRIDSESLPNIKVWVRNREKQDFFIQGWKRGKFYPDFVALTKKGTTLALEWKGADRKTNEDTIYKEQIAKNWETMGKGNLAFFLVTTTNIEEVLNEIKKIG